MTKQREEAASARPETGFTVCRDHQGRTCVEVGRRNGKVKYVTLDAGAGVRVSRMEEVLFDYEYNTRLPEYSARKALETYADYGRYTVGATKETISCMEKVGVSLSSSSSLQGEKTMSKAKAAVPAKAKPAAAKKAKETPAKKQTAAGMFQALIMEGKLTNDQIFERVKAEYGLDDKKRWYVCWYRNYLKKRGEKVPEARKI